jgi:hypothetical protein
MWGGFQTINNYDPGRDLRLPWNARLFWINSLLWFISAPVLLALFIVISTALLVGADVIPVDPLVRMSFLYVFCLKVSRVDTHIFDYVG